jgi:hypothetical protein
VVDDSVEAGLLALSLALEDLGVSSSESSSHPTSSSASAAAPETSQSLNMEKSCVPTFEQISSPSFSSFNAMS